MLLKTYFKTENSYLKNLIFEIKIHAFEKAWIKFFLNNEYISLKEEHIHVEPMKKELEIFNK